MKKLFEKLRKNPKSVQSKKDFEAQAWRKRGVVKMRAFNREEYPPIPGMEGPFQYRSGRVLYYDPREGTYYDRKTDMYLPKDFDPMRESLEEALLEARSLKEGVARAGQVTGPILNKDTHTVLGKKGYSVRTRSRKEYVVELPQAAWDMIETGQTWTFWGKIIAASRGGENIMINVDTMYRDGDRDHPIFLSKLR